MEHFQHLQDFNIHSSCRTCLDNLSDYHHDIFATPDLRKKVTICTSLPVEPGDGFPTSLCQQCRTKIDDFYNFRETCISAMTRFQKYIHSEKNPLALSTDSNGQQTDGMVLMEAKKEREDENSLSLDEEFSTLVEEDISNVKNQEQSSSEDDGEALDERKTFKNDSESDEDDTSNDESKLNINIQSSRKNNRLTLTTIDLECKTCKKSFKKPETFAAHMRVHQGLKPFPCQLCDKSYARRNRLKGHIKTKHEGIPEEKFPCTVPGCDRAMGSKQTLRKHIKDIHTDNTSKAKQPYICEECGKVLTSLATLKNHRYLHTGQQFPHECPQCQKRYITKNKLKEHMNRHAGIRNYICPHCGARKSTRSELKTHINYHTKEKTYPCQFCDMVFNSIGNFSRHKRIVHEGIKDYPCSFCEKSFGKAETRKHHEMTHTGEKPHECNICHKKFIQPVALKKHKKVHLKGGQAIW